MSDPTPTPSPDTIAWAHEALRCFADNNPLGGDAWCARHYVTSGWPCPVALDLAAKIEARDREVRADECDDIAEEFSGAPSRCDLEDRAEAWRLAPRPKRNGPMSELVAEAVEQAVITRLNVTRPMRRIFGDEVADALEVILVQEAHVAAPEVAKAAMDAARPIILREAAEADALRRSRRGKRRAINDKLLMRVAETYNAVERYGLEDVQAAFGVSHASACRYVRAAREAGFIEKRQS